MKSRLNNFILLSVISISIATYTEFVLDFNKCIQPPPAPKDINQNISEPYASLANWPLNFGACLFQELNQHFLELFIKTHKPRIIIEVGSFLGASTIFMASLMAEGAKIFAVDNWVWNGAPMYLDAHPQNIGYKTSKTYEQFLSNVKHYNMTNVIIPMHMDSSHAAKILDVTADLIYIDGDHSEAAVYNDIMRWYPKLSKTGIMCGDDWGISSVRSAVIRAAKELGKEIKADQKFWYFVF